MQLVGTATPSRVCLVGDDVNYDEIPCWELSTLEALPGLATYNGSELSD